MLTDVQGRDLTVTAELALSDQGDFLALRASNLSNLGAYAASFVPLTKGTELMTSLYRTPVARARAVFSNTISTAPYRSAGRPEVMFVMERLIDRAAREFGFDRISLRRRNLIPETALPYPNPFGMTYDSGAYEAVFDRTLALAEWNGYPTRHEETRGRGRCRGIGLGTDVESQSGAAEEEAVARVLPQGVIEVEIGTLSSGQGHETSYAQLLGEWLGVENERIRLVAGDSDRTKFGAGSHSGRSIRLASISMHASQRIIERGLQIASHLLEAAAENIGFADGRFTIKGTDRVVDLFTVAAAAEGDATVPETLRGPLIGAGDVAGASSLFPLSLADVPKRQHVGAQHARDVAAPQKRLDELTEWKIGYDLPKTAMHILQQCHPLCRVGFADVAQSHILFRLVARPSRKILAVASGDGGWAGQRTG
jgi:carbon-monoxide dehydrogenase large subunit